MESTSTPLSDLVEASQTTATTSARNEKVAALAGYLRTVAPDELPIAIALLTGVPRQGRVGIGWSTVAKSTVANTSETDNAAAHIIGASSNPLTLAGVDEAITQVSETSGVGSDAARQQIIGSIFARANTDEADFLSAVLVGGLRQGALGGVLASAISKAFAVKLGSVRRAAMLLGDLGEAGMIAATGGEETLAEVGLTVGRAVEPMLASTAVDVTDALRSTGLSSVEWKLDGIRIQVHKAGEDVLVFSRNLNDITGRTAGVVAAVRSMPADRLILDGEVLGSDPYFFDILHRDGRDLLSVPLRERIAQLAEVVGKRQIPSIVTEDPGEAQVHLDTALAAGHEGCMVKALDTHYEAGKRGKGWRKVKPVHTLDLIVLGAEWGHGRRKGWLSNLHLGARNDDGDGFVMVGKTFKGLTDDTLAWQTEQILLRETHREGITVFAEPTLVVEIAVDSSHASTRYPGGVALRFARVRHYRDDKAPAEVDKLAAVRALMVSLPVHDLPE